ncbi:MAG TPA: FAD-dependent oxidoreductase [Burkholderiales bacterium]|nr:FAD-dependent oxidoreductase [Burkholderiales bacterium]
MKHESVWMATSQRRAGRSIPGDLSVDVCVVGAGIAGLTAAYQLAVAGRTVAVLDDGAIGAGMTQMTSAHLSYAIDDFYFELEKLHGLEGIRLAAQSHRAAIDRIEAIAAAEGIDCDFSRVDGYLFLAEGDETGTLEKELDAVNRAGIADAYMAEKAPFGRAIRYPRCGQFHPLRYLYGLADAIERRGGAVYTGAHVDSIEGTEVRAGNVKVRCRDVVVATNVPVNDRFALHTKQAPYMTYIVGLRVPRGAIPSLLAWDTGDPYHYIRIAPCEDDDVLIVGGEDHKSGQADDQPARYARLEAWTRARFPMAGEVVLQWGGQVMETIDYLAFSGRNPGDEHVYVHTGDSGMGLTHGTLGAMLIADLITGTPNPWAALYDPGRKPARAVSEFLSENLNVARQYAKHFGGGEVSAPHEILPGEGALMRRGAHQIAVYRDPSGDYVERSAVCPHLGCVVQWNRTEKTWDCPCHGSRFDAQGTVINGPANRDLDAAAERRKQPRAA